MFSYSVEIKERGDTAWSPLSGWVQPFTYGTTLDDSLDSGKIMISQSTREAIIKPFTRIRITISEDGAEKDTIDCIVANSDRVMRRMSEPKLYDHTLELVELTKLLEREVCDTMTVTNYLGHDFIQGATEVQPQTEDTGTPGETGYHKFAAPYVRMAAPVYKSPVALNSELTVYRYQECVEYTDENGVIYTPSTVQTTVTVTAPSGQPVYSAVPPVTGAKISLTEQGTYTIKTSAFFNNPDITGHSASGNLTWSISVVKIISNGDDWDISEVVRRLLSAGVTRKTSESQKFKFDATQDAKFADMKSPEFFFTRGTLRDALSTVGGYLHGIPRLVDDGEEQLTVKFDMLSEGGQYEGTLPPAVYDDKQLIGDEYAGTFDSTVQNMLNTTNAETAAVVEPSAGTFRAINAAPGGFRIAANAEPVIPTDKPIYQVKKLEFWYSVGSDERAVDITPYVYENAEYSTLSSFGGAYPYSKSYALVYTQGQKNISGLTFVKSATSGDTLDSDYEYALVNILKLATGNDSISANNMSGYQFRITYIPYVTARVKQRKPYLTHPVDNTLIYNQAGNSVESEYYGENIRGAIMRTGNTSQTKTYVFRHYDDIPKIGQRIGRDYVAKVDAEFAQTYIKATVVTVKGFNKLAEYTGINSNYRLYDISEKQSVDRQINYSESVLITKNPPDFFRIEDTGSYNAKDTTQCELAFNGVLGNLISGSYPGSGGRVTAFKMIAKTGREPNANDNQTIIDPIIEMAAGAFACGNSIVLYTQMLDNFGAGYQSVEVDKNNYQRAQKLVPYSDTFGNISTAQILWKLRIPQFYNIPTPSPVESFVYPESADPENTSYEVFTNELAISKDSRESLSFAYQIHLQADDFNIIVGAGLAKYSQIVGGNLSNDETTTDKGVVYFLSHSLDPSTKIVDIEGQNEPAGGATLEICASEENGTKWFWGYTITTPANPLAGGAKSWAIVHPRTHELMLGANGEFAQGAKDSVTFIFCNNDYLNTLEMAD